VGKETTRQVVVFKKFLKIALGQTEGFFVVSLGGEAREDRAPPPPSVEDYGLC
jgi:hypothetical protein